MKTAHQIAQQYADTAAAAEQSESMAIAKDQIWGGEGYTVYVFDDNSLLAQSGVSQIAVDAGTRASVLEYIAWLGTDAPLDKQRIDDMLDALEDQGAE